MAKTGNNGFTLLETIISIALLAIAVLALASLQAQGIHGSSQSNRTTQAIALAQGKLEELINTSRSSVLAAGTTEDPNNPIDETGSQGGIFTRSWTIVENTPAVDAQTISVPVSWSDLNGAHTVTINGVITDDGY